MFQKLISKYATAAHLALLAVAPLTIFPFFGPSTVATVMLWLIPSACVWVLVEPSRRSDEMLHNARKRVASEIVRDPLLWFLAAIAILAFVRFANSGIAMVYDPATVSWRVSEPALEYMPASSGNAGYAPFVAVLAMTVIAMGIRHSLGKKARISFLLTSSFLAGASGIVCAVLAMSGYGPALAATACDTLHASFPGTAYGLYMLAALTAMTGVFDQKWKSPAVLSIIAAGGTATGLWYFAPSGVVMVFLVAAGAVILAGFVHLVVTSSLADALKMLSMVCVAAMIPLLFALADLPEGMSEARLAMMDGIDALFPAKFFEMREFLCGIAAKVWQANPWTGTGLGSFALDVRFNAGTDGFNLVKATQSCALNGWWTLLAERGIAGALSIALTLGFLFYSFVARMVQSGGRISFSLYAVLAVVSVAALAVEAFFDVSFLRIDVLMAAFSFVCLSAWTFPPKKNP